MRMPKFHNNSQAALRLHHSHLVGPAEIICARLLPRFCPEPASTDRQRGGIT